MKTRFGVCLDEELLDLFDEYIKKQNLPNRSEAIAHIMRKELDRTEWRQQKKDSKGLAVISICFDHHKRNLNSALISVQHDFLDIIRCSQHLHVDHDTCSEVILCLGTKSRINKFYQALSKIKGCNYG